MTEGWPRHLALSPQHRRGSRLRLRCSRFGRGGCHQCL